MATETPKKGGEKIDIEVDKKGTPEPKALAQRLSIKGTADNKTAEERLKEAEERRQKLEAERVASAKAQQAKADAAKARKAAGVGTEPAPESQ